MSAVVERSARLYIDEGYCCAEAVWLAFAEHGGLSEADMALGNKLSFAFCGGRGYLPILYTAHRENHGIRRSV